MYRLWFYGSNVSRVWLVHMRGWGYTTLGIKWFKGSNGTNVSSFHILKWFKFARVKWFKCLNGSMVQMVQGFKWFQGSSFSPPLHFAIMVQLVWLVHTGGSRVQIFYGVKLFQGSISLSVSPLIFDKSDQILTKTVINVKCLIRGTLDCLTFHNWYFQYTLWWKAY